MADIQSSVQVLRARGYKVTQPRKQVLKVLSRAEKPLSPYDIQEVLRREGKHLNHVTIYRILGLFCPLNLAHRIPSLGGFVRCSLDKEEGCHRFMICRQCGAFQEFANKTLCQEENEVAQNLGFHTEQHLSESVGLCSNCQEQAF